MGNMAYIVLDDETLEVEDTKARTDIGDVTTLRTNAKDNLVKAVNECFQSASDGKALIASAITGKGVNTDSGATYAVMAENISSIQVGIDTSDATATAGQMLSGSTAYARGSKVTGTMADKSGTTEYTATVALDTTNSELEMTVPAAGYYTASNKLKATFAEIASLIGLTSGKLASGNTILGIAGNRNVVDTSAGTATAGQILSGQVAYVDGVKLTGSMANRTGEIYATSSTYTDKLSVLPQAGYYNGTNAYSLITSDHLARILGITADKIMTGNVICGVTGTATGGIKVITGNIAYNVNSTDNQRLYAYYFSGSDYFNFKITNISYSIPFEPKVAILIVRGDNGASVSTATYVRSFDLIDDVFCRASMYSSNMYGFKRSHVSTDIIHVTSTHTALPWFGEGAGAGFKFELICLNY